MINNKVIFRMVAHNSEATIARAIESVLNQTYDNLELHAGIRASTDNTLKITNEYAAKDPRIRVIVNNQAFEYDEGNDIKDYYTEYDVERDYVCFIDGDDEYKPDFLEKMIPFAFDNNLDIACCGNDIIDVNTNEVIGARETKDTVIIEGEKFDTNFPMYRTFMCTRWAKLIRLAVIGKLDLSRIFWLYYCDDMVEMIEYYRNADRVGIFPETLYKWYYSAQSMSYKWDSRRIESDRVLHDLTARYLNDKTGHISRENYEWLKEFYAYTVSETLTIALNSQTAWEEKLSALHDILTSRHTRELFILNSGRFDDCRKEEAINYAVSWITSIEEKLCDRDSLNKALEVLAAVEALHKGTQG